MQLTNRWLRTLIALLLMTAVLALAIFWPQQDDLSALGDAGAPYNARILRDTWGVPHVFGRTDADAAYGLAYAHAEDDFETIQQALAAARGRLGVLFGPGLAPNDYMVQLLRIWETIDAGYDSALSRETRTVLEGYAAGLNHYAALHEDEALPGLFPVNGRDVVAGFVHKTPLFFGLDGALGELFEAERRRPISERAALPPATRYGSNTFAVGPGRSSDGQTMLAINAHQPWEGPVTWYEAHVRSEEGWDAVGGIFPGAPVILHGHNRDLGWAFTVNSPDLIDTFVLEMNPDNPDQYRFDGRWVDLEVSEAEIEVRLIGRLTWTVRQEILWSVYGPTVRRPHGVYALRYAGLGELGLVEQWYRLNKARDFDGWRAAMRQGSLPMFNTGYADREGNLFYVYNAQLPLRAEGYDWDQYLPGDTSETLWTDYLPFDELPQVVNPASDFFVNANHSPFRATAGADNPSPSEYSAVFGIDTRMSNRALRALEILSADSSITWDEFVAYKYDVTYSADSDMVAFVERLLAMPRPDDPALAEAVEWLAGWDFRADAGNRHAALAIVMLHFLNEADGARVDVSKLTESEVSGAMLLDSLAQAALVLREQHGGLDVPWSAVNRLQRGELELGLGGAPDVLHAVYGNLGADGRFRGTAGDSYVLLVEWPADGGVRSVSIHQFGSATLEVTSPHYADQAALFVERRLKPVWLDEADIRANLAREYRPGDP